MRVVYRVVGLVGLVVMCLTGPACVDHEPPEPTAAQLAGKLGILKRQQGFSDAQVRCVADEVTERLSGDALRSFGNEADALAEQGSAVGMSPASLKVFTAAIAVCAVPAG